MAAKASGIICLGQEDPLSEAEIKLKVTSKGLKTLIKSHKELKDKISERLLPQLGQSDETPEIHFHFKYAVQHTQARKRLP